MESKAALVAFKMTPLRKRMLERLAVEKGISFADLCRYCMAAAFALFEGADKETARAMIARQAATELVDQTKYAESVDRVVQAIRTGLCEYPPKGED
jgi:hypothetical protein